MSVFVLKAVCMCECRNAVVICVRTLCVCLLELKSPSATPAETRRALPQVPAPDSEAGRPRIPVDRPRLEVPPFNLPQTSGEDDGLLAYWWRFNGALRFNWVIDLRSNHEQETDLGVQASHGKVNN